MTSTFEKNDKKEGNFLRLQKEIEAGAFAFLNDSNPFQYSLIRLFTSYVIFCKFVHEQSRSKTKKRPTKELKILIIDMAHYNNKFETAHQTIEVAQWNLSAEE